LRSPFFKVGKAGLAGCNPAREIMGRIKKSPFAKRVGEVT
jgi:hypothetical protein